MKHITVLFLVALFTQAGYAQLIQFNSVEQYKTETVARTKFDPEKIFIPSETDFIALGNDLVANELFTFYGIIYHNELISATQLDNSSCWGQFLNLCKKVDAEDGAAGNIKIGDIPYLKNISFNPEKKTVVFVYLHTLTKRWIRRNINPILDEMQKDPAFDYIVFSMDYPRIQAE
jgi:hypothetical protein